MRSAISRGCVVACCAVLVSAQTRDVSSRFEVAIVKRSTADSAPMSIRRLPGRFITSNTPLPMLIAWAFDLDEGRLIGVPRGLDSSRFDVTATTPEELKPGQLQLMMQSLLAERFKLAVHREKRELTAYTLVTDSGGPKVRPSTATEASPNPFAMSGSGNLTGTRVTTDMLAKVLSNQLGRPVENTTGFTGVFDFTLQWTPDVSAAIVDDQSRPSLFTAVREQLGFRLVATKRPVEVIVIDRVESTPTEN